jgi:hypothetical protein
MNQQALWAIGKGTTLENNISVLCANKYQKVIGKNKHLPSYMQRRDNQPLAYAFETLELSQKFIENELYNKIIDSAKLFDDNQMLYKYKKTQSKFPITELVYSQNLVLKDDDLLTDFFLTTQTQLMFITDIHEEEEGFDVNATMIDVLRDAKLTVEHQHIFLDRLESNYKIDGRGIH